MENRTQRKRQPKKKEDPIQLIRNAIQDYYKALDNRQHGGIAQDKAFEAIEKILGMSWHAWQQREKGG